MSGRRVLARWVAGRGGEGRVEQNADDDACECGVRADVYITQFS